MDHDVFVEMPYGYSTPGEVWKLKRAIYGLKDAPQAFFDFTKDKMIQLGFRQSKADPCLFITD